MLALEAEMVLQGVKGRRKVRAADFFASMFATALRSDEMLMEIRIPALPSGTGTAYLKVEDKASHFAVVGVAAIVNVDSGDICRSARIAVTGVAAVPFRAGTAEAELTSKQLDPPTLEAAARHVVEGVQPLSDLFASGDYRAHLVQVYAARAVHEAVRRTRP